MELSAGRIEGKLLLLSRSAGDEGAAFVIDRLRYDMEHRTLPQAGCLVQARDDFAAEEPQVVAVLAQRPARQGERQQVAQERPEGIHQLLARR